MFQIIRKSDLFLHIHQHLYTIKKHTIRLCAWQIVKERTSNKLYWLTWAHYVYTALYDSHLRIVNVKTNANTTHTKKTHTQIKLHLSGTSAARRSTDWIPCGGGWGLDEWSYDGSNYHALMKYSLADKLYDMCADICAFLFPNTHFHVGASVD